MNRAGTLAAIALLTYPPMALAYIDPNLGLLAVQGIIAALGAVLIGARRVRDAVWRLLSRLFDRRAGGAPDDDA